MADERNFRAAYLEKVGCKNVLEKKSLEVLIFKESPVNSLKLKEVCLKYTVPTVYRSLIWNLALGIFPKFTCSKDYVVKQKKDTYADLLHALKIMRYVDEKTAQSQIFLAMFLLETRSLKNGINLGAETNFSLIAESILNFGMDLNEDYEAYFLTKCFYEISLQILSDTPKLITLTRHLLEKEDRELCEHFDNHNMFNLLHSAFEKWYPTMFSGILYQNSNIRIFDRIIGGNNSSQVVVFVFIVICTSCRYLILDQNNAKSIIKIIESNPGLEKSELIVNKAIASLDKTQK